MKYIPTFYEFINEENEPLFKTFIPDFSERYYGEFDKQIEQSRNDKNERIIEFCKNFHKKHPNREDCEKCIEAVINEFGKYVFYDNDMDIEEYICNNIYDIDTDCWEGDD